MNTADPVKMDAHTQLDITRDRCPMTYVRVRLALDRLSPGDVLLVELQGDEPLRNVPRSAEAAGHRVLRLLTEADGRSRLWLQKAAPPAE